MSDEEKEDGNVSVPAAFYDPELDGKDSSWVDGIRGGRKSDAILSCPCCFATLSVDCQQHDTNPNRYRAMFVMNTKINHEAKRYPYRSQPRGKRKGSSPRPRAGMKMVRSEEMDGRKRAREDVEDVCLAVLCADCGLEVAVYDNEGVYHFLKVLPSTA